MDFRFQLICQCLNKDEALYSDISSAFLYCYLHLVNLLPYFNFIYNTVKEVIFPFTLK